MKWESKSFLRVKKLFNRFVIRDLKWRGQICIITERPRGTWKQDAPIREISLVRAVGKRSFILDILDEKMVTDREHNSLRRLRRYAELTQNMLAQQSGVPLRQIQMFEQGQRDIRKTQGQTLLQLAHVLNCRVEDLLR